MAKKRLTEITLYLNSSVSDPAHQVHFSAGSNFEKYDFVASRWQRILIWFIHRSVRNRNWR